MEKQINTTEKLDSHYILGVYINNISNGTTKIEIFSELSKIFFEEICINLLYQQVSENQSQ